MSEIIYTYPIDNPEKIEPMDRKNFYTEQSVLDLPTRYVGVVHGILLNTRGELILQKRADNKGHNPGMYDKSFGGHIQYGSTAGRTMLEETIQELGIPSFHSRDESEFIQSLETNKDFLGRVAIIKHVAASCNIDTRLMGGKKIKIGNKTDFFIGVSNVNPEFIDGETQGAKTISLEALDSELEKDTNHTIYTDDLRNIIKIHRWNIAKVLDLISKL